MTGVKTGMQMVDVYGGPLVNLMIAEDAHAALMEEAAALPSLQLSAFQAAWLGLLATGALSPLDRFMGRADYKSVCGSLRLTDGRLFPVPIILAVKEFEGLREGASIALRDTRNHLLALLLVEEIFECASAEGALDGQRPRAISGPLRVLGVPGCLMFPGLRRTPAEVREWMSQLNCAQVLAIDDCIPLGNEVTKLINRTAEELNAAVLLNLPALEERVDDFQAFARLDAWNRKFEALLDGPALLNFLNFPNGLNDARGVLLRAILHKNYGAHRYMFAPPQELTESGNSKCRTLTSHEALQDAMAEIGIQPMPLQNRHAGVKDAHRPRKTEETQQGFCIWLTGLPGAGKSTIAERLTVCLMEHGRVVTLLDGDVVRTNLSRGLSFSREDRDANVQRIGFVASEIVRHGGIAICAAVSPYRTAREQVRCMMPPGAFIEIYVDTPVSVCEQRDVKGFYAKARKGQVKSFTGVDDPYEPPENPEIWIATDEASLEEEERQILDYLLRNNLINVRNSANREGEPA